MASVENNNHMFSNAVEVLKLVFTRKSYIVTFVLNILIQAIEPMIVVLLSYTTMDLLVNSDDTNTYLLSIVVVIGIMLVVNVFSRIFRYLTLKYLYVDLPTELDRKIYAKQLELNYEQITDKEVRKKMEFATSFTKNDRLMEASNCLVYAIAQFFAMAGLVSILLIVSDFFIILVLFLVLLNSIEMIRSKKKTYKIVWDTADKGVKIRYYDQICRESETVKESKVFETAKPVMDNIKKVNEEQMMVSIKGFRIWNKTGIISTLLNYVLEITLYLYLGYLYFEKGTINLPELTAMITAVKQLSSILKNFINNLISYFEVAQHVGGYKEFEKIKTKSTTKFKTLKPSKKYEIEFRNVSYKYNNDEDYIIENLSVKIKPNEKISIVGKNGAGKTTFVKLMMGLLEPTNGEILVNGQDISEINIKEYYMLFSSVSQNFKLFPFSILDNITNISDKRKVNKELYDKSLSDSGIKNRINRLEEKDNTKYSKEFYEDGVEFSGGESQKIAMARTIYKDSPIMILDEPTSALDPRSEFELYSKFNDIAVDKTVLFVTHRLSSVKFSSRVLVFEGGKIIGDGKHKELIKSCDKYNELYTTQADLYVGGDA